LENREGVQELFYASARVVLNDRGLIDIADWSDTSHFEEDPEEQQYSCNLM